MNWNGKEGGSKGDWAELNLSDLHTCLRRGEGSSLGREGRAAGKNLILDMLTSSFQCKIQDKSLAGSWKCGWREDEAKIKTWKPATER